MGENRRDLSSRPEELHLRALPEPCMTLSSHTAPDVQPLLERLCLAHGLLPSPVGPWPRLNNAAPSVQLHYRAFIPVESGEVGLIALPPPARSNGSCSFPASRFPMWVALIGEGWVVFQGRGRSAARGRSL